MVKFIKKGIFKDLINETLNTQIPLKNLGWGIECRNSIYKRNVVLSLENDLNIINAKLKKGWKIFPGVSSYILKSPEATLCDLSQFDNNPSNNAIDILSFFYFLKSADIENFIEFVLQKENIKNLHYRVIKSDGYFESCFRITGSNMKIKNLPKLVFLHAKNTELWKHIYYNNKYDLNNREVMIKNASFCSLCERTKSEYISYVSKFNKFNMNVNFQKISTYKNIWNQLNISDFYVFIPQVGFKYLLGFIDEGVNSNYGIWEHHSNLNNNKEVYELSNYNENYDSISVIDISYCGLTIENVAKKIGKFFTNLKKIYKIGFFPKSRQSFSKLDYVLFVDKLIKTKDINVKQPNFFINLFKDVMNNNICHY